MELKIIVIINDDNTLQKLYPLKQQIRNIHGLVFVKINFLTNEHKFCGVYLHIDLLDLLADNTMNKHKLKLLK